MAKSDFERWLVETVDRVGWAVLSVAPREGSDDVEEWFSYTIGLGKTFGWPEIICFGLGTETRKLMLNDAVDECRRRSLKPSPGTRLSEVLEGFDVMLAAGEQIADHYFGSAMWFNRDQGISRDVARLQLLWPDENGRFPGDPLCAADVTADQTPQETP